MNYTILPQQIQCNECKQTQLATNNYCCNCGVKFIKGLGVTVPDKTDVERWIAAEKNLWNIPPVTCDYYSARTAKTIDKLTSCIGTSREVLDKLEQRAQSYKPTSLWAMLGAEEVQGVLDKLLETADREAMEQQAQSTLDMKRAQELIDKLAADKLDN